MKNSYKSKSNKREYGKCPICEGYALLDNHGKTTRAKSNKEHDETLIGLCHNCHINKVHGMTPRQFKGDTGQPLSKYLNYKKKFWVEE